MKYNFSAFGSQVVESTSFLCNLQTSNTLWTRGDAISRLCFDLGESRYNNQPINTELWNDSIEYIPELVAWIKMGAENFVTDEYLEEGVVSCRDFEDTVYAEMKFINAKVRDGSIIKYADELIDLLTTESMNHYRHVTDLDSQVEFLDRFSSIAAFVDRVMWKERYNVYHERLETDIDAAMDIIRTVKNEDECSAINNIESLTAKADKCIALLEFLTQDNTVELIERLKHGIDAVKHSATIIQDNLNNHFVA